MGLPSSAEGVLAGQSDASLLPAALPVALGATTLPALPWSPWPLILLPTDSSTFLATVPRVATATVGWHEAASGPGVGVSPGLSPLRPPCLSPWGEHPARLSGAQQPESPVEPRQPWALAGSGTPGHRQHLHPLALARGVPGLGCMGDNPRGHAGDSGG